MTFDHPLVLWAVPVAAFWIALLERSVPATRLRRVARVALRTAVVGLALVALAGPHTTRPIERPRRLVVAWDAADRPGLDDREGMRLVMDRAADAASLDGVPTTQIAFTTHAAAPGGSPRPSRRSSLAAALSGARLAFGDGETGGVLVVTDGRGDLAGARATVEALRADGIAVSAVAVPAEVPPAVPAPRILALDARPTAGGPFAVRAEIALPRATPHRMALLVDGVEVEALARRGDAPAEVRFAELELAPGVHELAVLLQVPGAGDADAEELLVRRLVDVEAPPRVLSLLADAAASPWSSALRAQGLTVTAGRPEALRDLLLDARTLPDLVVADAAALAALAPDAAHVLAERVRSGLGLVLEAGADAGAWAALARGPLAGVLPLAPLPEPEPPPPPAPEPQEDPPPPIEPPEDDEGPGLAAERRPEEALPITLLLLVDRSPSMDGPKMEMAKVGAAMAARALSPWDRIGVITFADDVSVDIPPRSARGADSIPIWLSSVRAGGQGTNIFGALKRAAQLLAAEKAPILHVVLLTDGRQYPTGPLFGPIVKPMGRRGVTITAVGIGRGARMDQLRDIVQWAARGRTETAATPADIPRVLTRDTRGVAAKRRADAEAIDDRLRDERKRAEPRAPEPATPPPPRRAAPDDAPPPGGEGDGPPEDPPVRLRRAQAHEALAGFTDDAWPAVGAPRRADRVQHARVLLEREDGSTVLAAGRAGLGRVLAWALPPADRGALAWELLGRLFGQAGRAALAPRGALEHLPRGRVARTRDGARLHVQWPPGVSTGQVHARWSGPDGQVRAAGVFTPTDGPEGRRLPAAEPGTRCRVDLELPGGPALAPLSYLAPAPPPPVRLPGDERALSTALGTDLVPPARFARSLPRLRRPLRTPRWPLFLWLAVALLPLDVFLHRRGSTP